MRGCLWGWREAWTISRDVDEVHWADPGDGLAVEGEGAC